MLVYGEKCSIEAFLSLACYSICQINLCTDLVRPFIYDILQNIVFTIDYLYKIITIFLKNFEIK